jgi:hypothetical protein
MKDMNIFVQAFEVGFSIEEADFINSIILILSYKDLSTQQREMVLTILDHMASGIPVLGVLDPYEKALETFYKNEDDYDDE